MSAPQTIREYVHELNDSLRVRLSRRGRILAETRGHLEQAVEAELARGVSRAEAERRAIAAFGPPQEVAASFGVEGATVIGRAAVAVADVFYRKYGRDWRLFIRALSVFVALSAVLAISLVALGLGRNLLVVLVVCAYGGYQYLRRVVALPRPGYTRRFLKLDANVRERLLGALREGKPVPDAQAADYAAEVASRARGLGPSLLVHTILFAYFVGEAVALEQQGLGSQIAWGALALVVLLHFPIVRSRGARSARAELTLLQLLDEVMQEPHDPARLIERPKHIGSPDFENVLVFTVEPASGEARSVKLAANYEEIRMWANGQRIRFRGPNRMRELRLCLASFVAGRYETTSRTVSRRTRLHWRRRAPQLTTVFETEDGPRRFSTDVPTARGGTRGVVEAVRAGWSRRRGRQEHA